MVAITGRRRLIAKKFRNGPRQRQLVDVWHSDQASVDVGEATPPRKRLDGTPLPDSSWPRRCAVVCLQLQQ